MSFDGKILWKFESGRHKHLEQCLVKEVKLFHERTDR